MKISLRVAAALALVGLLSGFRYTGWSNPANRTASHRAADWLETQQRPDGGFEVAGFAGFETPDAILAIAEAAQQQPTWNMSQARAAVAAVERNGNTPLDAIDDFAEGELNAGQAAKLIQLVSRPLGYLARRFDPQGDGPTNLRAIVIDGLQPDGSFGFFNATLYAAITYPTMGLAVPPKTMALIRAAQKGNGGWSYDGLPTNEVAAEIDTTSLAIQALIGAGRPASDADVRQGLRFLARQQRTSGAWQAFGSDDPNSTAMAILAVTAAGYDPGQKCWRNVVAPALAPVPYKSPVAWLRNRQATDGHIVSPSDGFGLNTFATSQGVQALRRGWLPIRVADTACP